MGAARRPDFLRIIAALTAISLALQGVTPAAVAADGKKSFLLSEEVSSGGNEFISGNYPGAVLMPVFLWGAAAKRGIHHIPTRTDLLTFLSLAGGPDSSADLGDITIKRRIGGKERIIKVDLDDILDTEDSRAPELEPNDIVIIPVDKPTVNADFAATIGFTASIIGLILAGMVLSDRISGN